MAHRAGLAASAHNTELAEAKLQCQVAELTRELKTLAQDRARDKSEALAASAKLQEELAASQADGALARREVDGLRTQLSASTRLQRATQHHRAVAELARGSLNTVLVNVQSEVKDLTQQLAETKAELAGTEAVLLRHTRQARIPTNHLSFTFVSV